MNDPELKPCPFCGRPAAIRDDDGQFGAYRVGMVICTSHKCGARIYGSMDGKAEMARVWNTRAGE